ncbi:MAG: pseudouridine synthase [Psittacicella sp.]
MFIYNPPKDELKYLYYDNHIAVVEKPSGLLSVSGRLDIHYDSCHTRVRQKFNYAEPAHRLDMATSGILIFSLSKLADRELKKQFREKTIQKKYEALVWSHPEKNSGVINLPLICDWENRPKQEVSYIYGKKSITEYKIIEKYKNNIARVELTPITGRTHQLRLHMQAIGNPILGDRIYSHKAAYNLRNRLCLHSKYIEFNHPLTHERLSFYSKPNF